MSVLMAGVDASTKGGMWTAAENYLRDSGFVGRNDLVYAPTAITGCSAVKRLVFSVRAYFRLRRIFKKKNIDITHVHMSERASILRKHIIMKYAKKKGSKIVLHMHGAEFGVLYEQMGKRGKTFVRKTLCLADRVIILGEYWREFISGLVDDPSRVTAVHNAVKVPDAYEYSTDSNTLLFLGAVSARKGIDVLLRALSQKQDVLRGRVRMNIYGPDTEGNIEEKIAALGLGDWTFYCGYLEPEDKPAVLRTAAVNILPSYNEGLPMTILEAMSYGVPSVTTTVAAIPEAVTPDNGILVSPGDAKALGDAIERLVIDTDCRARLSRGAYRDARRLFTVEKHIDTIQEIYDSLLR